MPDYCFYIKDKHIVALESADVNSASQLTEQGFEKQFEEVDAMNEKGALARFAQIRKDKATGHHNFMAGAIAMPLIGVMTAVANKLTQKK